ncbi:hypothetical protein KY285_009945 [Solanum tuberosum]|nr:hypothetical protein KY285_009945 [Solanum tuberosum]
MASLNKLPILLLISLILCFFSSCSINANDDILDIACEKDKECLDYIKADKVLAAATTTDLDLGLALMKSIVAQTKTTHDYVLKKKIENPVYTECEKEWLDMGPNFQLILDRTAKNKGYKDDTDDYDFHNVGDASDRCKTSLKNANIIDPELNRKSHELGLLMVVANRSLTHLSQKKQGLIK